MDLEARWLALWKRLGANGSGARVFADLVRRYSQDHRFYHNLDHWQFGLGQLDLLRDQAEHPDLVEVAYGFHDSFYDIGATDNEDRSATLSIEVLDKAGINGKAQVLVAFMIMVTKPGEVPKTADQKVIADIDLAILGQDPNVFDDYEAKVWQEYCPRVDQETFWRVRKGILQGFLDREVIYFTEQFRALYEQKARANLERTIKVH